MSGLDKIDIKPKDKKIDQQEIEQALKPDGILTKEENIKAVAKELDLHIKGNKREYYIDRNIFFTMYGDIEEKIKADKDINQQEITLLKLYLYLIEGESNTSFEPIDDYKKDPIVLVRIHQINPLYKRVLPKKTKEVPIVDKNHPANKDREKKIQEEEKKQLPMMRETGAPQMIVSQIELWYKSNYPQKYDHLQQDMDSKTDSYERTHLFSASHIISPIHLSIHVGEWVDKKLGYRGAEEKIRYHSQEMRYMMLLVIMNEYIQAQQEGIQNILDTQGRDEKKYQEEFDYYMEYMEYYLAHQDVLLDFQETKISVEEYGKGVKDIMQKNYQGNIEQKKSDEKNYNLYMDDVEEKYGGEENKQKLEKINALLDKDISKLTEGDEEDINFYLQYISDIEDMKEKYDKKNIERYGTCNNELYTLYSEYEPILTKFTILQEKIQELFGNSPFDKKRVEKFQNAFQKINTYQKNIDIVTGEYTDKNNIKPGLLEYLVTTDPSFDMLYKVGWENVDPAQKQAKLDEFYQSQPGYIQTLHTIGTALSNVGTRFIGGMGGLWVTGLSALPLGDKWQDSVKCAGYIRNKDIIDPITFRQTSLQQKSIIEEGWFNPDKLSRSFWEAFDSSKVSGSTTTRLSQSTSTIGNMILLIAGGKMMGGRNIGIKIGKAGLTGTTGLIKMSMILSVGPSFQKYSEAGFDPMTASLAAFIESGIVSGMELINVGPYFSKNTIKNLLFSRKGYFKTILKDLVGENIQELSQTGAEKLSEIVFNNIGSLLESNGHIDVEFSAEEIANTILLTTIATLVVSSPGNIKNVYNNNNAYAHYDKIRKNPVMSDLFIQFIEGQKGKEISLLGLDGPQVIDDALIGEIKKFMGVLGGTQREGGGKEISSEGIQDPPLSNIDSKKASELTIEDIQNIDIGLWIKILKNSGYAIEGDMTSRSITLDGKEITLDQLNDIIGTIQKEVLDKNNKILTDVPPNLEEQSLLSGSITNINSKSDYTIYNEFVQYCEHPVFADLLLDPRFINNLPPQLRVKETFKKMISNSSRLQNIIGKENIYGEEVTVSGSINQHGKERGVESGREILMQQIIEEGIDPNYILVFRRTQSSGDAKPELYWTTDFNEVFSGLQQEISGSNRENSVVFCSTLAEISRDSRLIRDINDDGGISLRRINEGGYDRQRNLFEIQEGTSNKDEDISRLTEKFYMENNLIGSGLENTSLLSKEEKILALASKYNFDNMLKSELEKGSLLGTCGFSSYSLLRFLDYYQMQTGEKINIYTHQNANLPLGGGSHSFLVVEFPSGKKYILDNTFSQFLNNNFGTEENVFGYLLDKHPERKPYAERLLKYGFIELNETTATIHNSLIQNLDLTNKGIQIEHYLDHTDDTLRDEYSEDELIGRGYLPLTINDINENNTRANANLETKLTTELATKNPTKYQEILIEKLSADPAYKDILETMEKNGTKIIVNPGLDTRGGYDKSTNTIEINPTRDNRNDGSLWGEGGYGLLSGDQLTLAVMGHEMHHFLFENTLQKNRGASVKNIIDNNMDDWGGYELIIAEISDMLSPGKTFVYHTNTEDGIKAYRSNIMRDAELKPILDNKGNTIPFKALNDYLVAEENVIELSRLYSQGQLDGYLQYLVDTEQSILDEKGLQKITLDQKAEISGYIERVVGGARGELNVNKDGVFDGSDVDV